MIRVAATGDIHYGKDSQGKLARYFPELEGRADCLLIAGDLTQLGTIEEAEVLAFDLRSCPVPVITVLGNHDFHSDLQESIQDILSEVPQVTVLECDSCQLHLNSARLGVFGMKGFGGGFQGACCSDFGEPQTKAFIRHTKALARQLNEGLTSLEADFKVALLHYSPVAETLLGEKKEIYPFLGSYLLAEAIDQGGANIVFHGHAHRGTERGRTLGGIPVRNVAQPVIRHAFNIYCLAELAERSAPPPLVSC